MLLVVSIVVVVLLGASIWAFVVIPKNLKQIERDREMAGRQSVAMHRVSAHVAIMTIMDHPMPAVMQARAGTAAVMAGATNL